jgi:hypothetical protein
MFFQFANAEHQNGLKPMPPGNCRHATDSFFAHSNPLLTIVLRGQTNAPHETNRGRGRNQHNTIVAPHGSSQTQRYRRLSGGGDGDRWYRRLSGGGDGDRWYRRLGGGGCGGDGDGKHSARSC